MTNRAVIKRVAVREYLPLVALVLVWLGIAASVGAADAVRLLAAVTFVRSARSLAAPASILPLRMRIRGGAHEAQARVRVLQVEAAALTASLLAVAAVAALLWASGQYEMILLCLLFSLSLPIRSLMPLAAGRQFGGAYRLALAIIGIGLIAAGWMAGADVYLFAALLAVRGWIALPIAFAFARPVAKRPDPLRPDPVGPLEWREVADHSYRLGRKRAAYRFSRTFLQAVLGPFGSIAARTGRGMRLDRKAERFVPERPATLGVIAAAGVAAALGLILYFPEPALLVVAASLIRMSAAAANVLVWGRLSGWGGAPDDGADEEYDDD